jgi:hypothetical protein
MRELHMPSETANANRRLSHCLSGTHIEKFHDDFAGGKAREIDLRDVAEPSSVASHLLRDRLGIEIGNLNPAILELPNWRWIETARQRRDLLGIGDHRIDPFR